MPRPVTRGWTRLQSHSALSISGLPSEVLHRIAEVLDATHPRSLVAFAQTNKHLYAVASRSLFSTLKFTVTDRQRLDKDVQVWETILFRDGGLKHVRRLILRWDGEDDGIELDHNPYLSLKECERSYSDTNLETCWDLYYYQWAGGEPGSGLNGDEWESMARLLKRLTGLADFLFACPGPFPPLFLQILHERSPRCRLHHYTFRLSASDEASLQADERSLITSPCLATIADLSSTTSPDSLNTPGVRLLTRRNAPSLRRVFFHWRRAESYEAKSHSDEDKSKSPDLPALQYLQIFGHYSYPPSWFGMPEDWLSPSIIDREVLYDYSALRVLRLNTPMKDQALPSPSNFSSLVTFSVLCPDKLSNPAWSSSFLSFLRDLPSIKSLRVLGWPRSISFTPGLNKQLQTLHLDTRGDVGQPLLQDHVLQLADMFPALEDLRIEIKRSRGDAAEVARYRALGRLPRLRRLKLILDAAPPPIIPDDIVEVPARGQGPWQPYYPWPGHTDVEPWFEDGWDSEYIKRGLNPHRNGHVRDVLVNSAVDSALALSIFRVINSAKVSSLISSNLHNIRGHRSGQSSLTWPGWGKSV